MQLPNDYTDFEEPISTMRTLTRESTPFKLEFIKKDGSKRIIQKALLRKQSRTQNDKNAPYKLQYINAETDDLGSCYIPLITALNDRKITLK